FATKLWNVARLRQMQGPKLDRLNRSSFSELSIYALEVLARLNETIDAVEQAYRAYEFNTVAQRLYDFVWSDYCDWFVEAAKTDIFGGDEGRKKLTLAVMDHVLSAVVRLLHPFMPHITEELWSLLGLGSESIQFAPLLEQIPFENADPTENRKLVAAIYETVQAGRNLRAEAGIPSNKKTRFVLRPENAKITDELPTLKRLLNADEVTLDRQFKAESGVPMTVTKLGDLFLSISGPERAAERERLNKEITRLEAELKTVQAKLANKSFVDRAPAAVVEEHRQREKNFAAQLAKLKEARGGLT
ncbi:MAG: class I tRNA ligase family protein, partial [Chthoniobacterales bacterium]